MTKGQLRRLRKCSPWHVGVAVSRITTEAIDSTIRGLHGLAGRPLCVECDAVATSHHLRGYPLCQLCSECY